jgi:hypothetical protein
MLFDISHANVENCLLNILKKAMKFRKTFEKMEGFSFVTPVTVLNRPNTGKEDDEKSNEMPISK